MRTVYSYKHGEIALINDFSNYKHAPSDCNNKLGLLTEKDSIIVEFACKRNRNIAYDNYSIKDCEKRLGA